MDANNTQAALVAGQQLGEIKERHTEICGVPVLLSPPGAQVHVLEKALEIADERAEAPRRRAGTATLSELASFIAHVNRFKDPDSVVFANVAGVQLVSVLDYHKKGEAAAGGQRWGEHRGVYTCPLSEAWKRWNGCNGKKFRQEEFAQFIEDYMDDLASPTGNGEDKDLPAPSEVLTMARNLVIRSKGAFERSINPVTGEHSLICRNEHESTSTKIPRAFLLKLQVFEAGAYYAVQARMRLEMGGGAPIFSYALYRAEEIKRDAFNEVRQMVEEQTKLPLLAGEPE